MSGIPKTIDLSEELLEGIVGGQLMSSLLAVCCVTVAFCSNMVMVNNKITGARNDFLITPVRKSAIGLAYYISALISTLIICFITFVLSMIYLHSIGWYMSGTDIMLLAGDTLLL